MARTLLAVVALVAGLGALPANAAPMDPLQHYKDICGNVVENLPIVRKQTVAAVDDDAHISFHAVCQGVSMTTYGNAGGLSYTIRHNPVLAHALARYGLTGDNVVGITIYGNRVTLYVHRD